MGPVVGIEIRGGASQREPEKGPKRIHQAMVEFDQIISLVEQPLHEAEDLAMFLFGP